MTGAELLSEAVAELYASDLDAFIERRRVLAARARSAGEASAAKRIAGLRKPTRSAWVINQLVRADPSVTPGLAALGDQLRAAEAALDGAKIRELSRARRQLIDTLVRQALSGQPSPPATLREEVTATFSAALADPQVAAELAAGTLLRPAHRAGFGAGTELPPSGTELPPAGTEPPLALVPPPGGRRLGPGPTRPAIPARPAAHTAAVQISTEAAEAQAAKAQAAAEAQAAAKAQVAAKAQAAEAQARAEADREHRQAIAEADRAVADADVAADAAVQAEQDQERAIQIIEEQLADTRKRLVRARQGLADARLQARQAKSAQHKARQALGRLHR
jgi:hypothetical protein